MTKYRFWFVAAVLTCLMLTSSGALAVASPPDIRIAIFQGQRLQIQGNSQLVLLDQNERLIGGRFANNKCIVRLKGGRWQVTTLDGHIVADNIGDDRIKVVVLNNAPLSIGDQTAYRGRFVLVKTAPDRFVLINTISVEDYLLGVVGAEMPPSWPLAALKSQAIACRTYSLHELFQKQHHDLWDVYGDQRSQVYRPLDKMSITTKSVLSRAISETEGVVLTCGIKHKEKLFPAFYSAACGGFTQSAHDVFRRSWSVLISKRCTYCQNGNSDAWFWSTQMIDKREVSRRLFEKYKKLLPLGEITQVAVARQSEYGRVESLLLSGLSGQCAQIRAIDFRLAVSSAKAPIKSSWYTLIDGGSVWRFENGRGYGHGVGLCQHGAGEMARLGYHTEAILDYYYPDAMLVKAY
jgi:stage II sporulation protein D